MDQRDDAVELEFIGLDRFKDVERSSDPADEDAFCRQLRRFGAEWYELPPRWPWPALWCDELDDCVDPVERVQLIQGFTDDGGGVGTRYE